MKLEIRKKYGSIIIVCVIIKLKLGKYIIVYGILAVCSIRIQVRSSLYCTCDRGYCCANTENCCLVDVWTCKKTGIFCSERFKMEAKCVFIIIRLLPINSLFFSIPKQWHITFNVEQWSWCCMLFSDQLATSQIYLSAFTQLPMRTCS